ncbi:MAG: alcohol dehydrogenase catalytic domain-containing protein [Candidatus Thorarchaeota archaeon]|nr:alcohol dehydrogenase catalytic domain-containing protein [Candidatus Thorarchaeota archaeon]
MQSLVLTRDGLQVADTPITPLMPGDVRIEVRSVGICGTDIAIWKGDFSTPLPIILGHEIAGVVHESSVPEFTPGAMVTTEVDLACGRCWYCNNHLKHLCITKQTLGITIDGGLREYLSVPADLVHLLPEGVNMVAGTFVEPLASAIQTQVDSPVKSGEVVLVMGSGKLGLLISQIYDATGAEVLLLDRNRYQLGLGRQLGLTNTINTAETDWKKAVLDATSGVGPALVVEATGTPDGFIMALEIVRNRGTIALKSMHGNGVQVNTTEIVNREIRIVGTSRGPYDKALDMLSKGRIEVNRLISEQFTLEEGAKAFEYASQPNVTKVLVNI